VLEPSAGALLHGVRVELTAQVLPALPEGAARRQLKAALHTLRRLERCWDRQRTYLVTDNAYLLTVIDALLKMLAADPKPGYRMLGERLQTVVDDKVLPDKGITDPELAMLTTSNHLLQQILADLGEMIRADPHLPDTIRRRARADLRAIHRHRLEQSAHALGVDDGP
jgi:predicted metal-dependent hydrolase